jgi:quinol monooxygenase YgiN
MIIVSGEFTLEPEQRDEFIAGRGDAMRASRAEDGCIEYTFSADPLDAGRVLLFERWTSQAALDAHLAAMRSGPRPPASNVKPISTSIMLYDVTSERPLA